jgi:DNA repair protein RadD
VFRHGLPEDRVEWTLDPERRAIAPQHQERQSRRESKLLECSQCQTLRVGGMPCPNCDFQPRRPAEYVRHIDGDLGLVTNGRARDTEYDPETRRQWHSMFAHIARDRGYKPGWAAYKYKEKFGAWPPWGVMPEPLPPTPEVKSWVRSRMIAYAKARASA